MAVTDRARRLRAEGRDVISFGAGEPDFPTPSHIVQAAIEACADPKNHKYTANPGLPELRQAVADITARDGGPTVSPSQVLITNGGKQAVFQAFAALLDPGDEVLIPSPYWVTYPEAVRLAGGIPVPVDTDSGSGFRVTIEQLEAATTDKTKLLVFVSPSNPTGAVYPPEEVAAIARWAGQQGLWVLTDEIYQYLVYEGAEFSSIAVAAPELDDRWVIVSGVAKTFAMTGWRVGWMIGPADVITAADTHQSHCTSNVANVSQRAALAALTGPMEPMYEMREAFDRRRRTMFEMLSAIPGVRCVEPLGAFYCFPDVSGRLGGETSTSLDLATYLLEQAEVTVVPGEAFGAPGHFRLSYALGDDDLVRGIERISKLLR